MPDFEETAESLAKKKRKKERRKKLLALIHQILSGQFDSKQEPADDLFQMDTSSRDMIQSGPRPHYVSPRDRSSYNSGYMTISEIGAGTPNIW